MTTKKTVTTTHGRFTVDGSTSEKMINLMQAPYEKIVSVHDAETGKEIPQKSPSTILKADGSVNDSAESAGEICTIEFTEQGYNVISDARRIKIGYLHICEESADQVTDACRDQIVNYLFNHPQDLPGVGKTPQKQYFAGLSTADTERIGNKGKKAYYNQ